MVALGWVINAYAESLEMLYLGAVVGGIGGGAVYATCVGQAVKWFPDRRGLAVGLTAAGYGAGAALTVIPIRAVIAPPAMRRPSSGLAWSRAASFSSWRGCCAGPIRRDGRASPRRRSRRRAQLHARAGADHAGFLAALHHVRHGVGVSGLMATAQIAPIAKDFNVGDTVLLFGASTLSAGADRRQSLQRRRASAVRLDFRQHRPRIHHGDRLRPGRHRLLAARELRPCALGVRGLRRADLPDLGRDLQPVPVDLHGYLRDRNSPP